MWFGKAPLAEAEGALLAHSIKTGDVRLKKAHKLTADDIAALRAEGFGEITLARLAPSDVGEDEAAQQLAMRMAGAHVRLGPAATGRVNLYADVDGVLDLDAARLEAFNQHDPSLTVATLPAFASVHAGDMIATVKIIPFAVPQGVLDAGLGLIEGPSPALSVRPYRARMAGLIQTTLPDTKASMLDKTAKLTAARLEACGGQLANERRCAHAFDALRAELADMLETREHDVILIAGASAICDERDIMPAAIEAVGGEVVQFGMPVDPGNLLLLAHHGTRTIIGLPGCARSPKLNGFDWVLHRLAADLPVGRAELRGMGVGGLLSEIPSRPQPRELRPSQAIDSPKIAAVVLAAGQSRRMGAHNKLLVPIDGKPMLRHILDALIEAGIGERVVVTGHERDAVANLVGCDARLVYNADYAQGLSTSLATGMAALGEDIDGALVCLGDMPRIRASHLRALIAAFAPEKGQRIVVPTVQGKRGNPVLWSRRFFAEMGQIEGDVGARHLIGTYGDQVVEVAMDDGAALLDIDTPAALDALTKAHVQ